MSKQEDAITDANGLWMFLAAVIFITGAVMDNWASGMFVIVAILITVYAALHR